MTTSKKQDPVLSAWTTGHCVTAFLVKNLPEEVWSAAIPGAPRRTVRMICGHLHNSRCMWIKMIGKKYGVEAPRSVNRQRVTQAELLPALERSHEAMLRLLEQSLANGGRLPGFSPPDATHFMAYLVAHEGHHRGQIVMVARQIGHRLPADVTNGLWQWSKRRREAGG